jgi:hypothetical protein
MSDERLTCLMVFLEWGGRTGPQRVKQIGDGDTSSPVVATAVLVRNIVSVVQGFEQGSGIISALVASAEDAAFLVVVARISCRQLRRVALASNQCGSSR